MQRGHSLTTRPRPKVTIGLPVYNGERFLRRAIESVLAQDFTDFELILSDNASEDATADICREYAAKDPRVIYDRNQRNLGAAYNHNKVVRMARGQYFKWAAYDDWLEPTFLSKCVAVLDARPEVVNCYAGVRSFDENGRFVDDHVFGWDASSPRARRRFHTMLWNMRHCYMVFGLMRAKAMLRTHLLRTNHGADRSFLMEMVLQGPFHEIPEYLFFDTNVETVRRQRDASWWDTSRRGHTRFMTWKLFAQFMSAATRAPVNPVTRALMVGDVILRHAVRNCVRMAKEIAYETRAAILSILPVRSTACPKPPSPGGRGLG